MQIVAFLVTVKYCELVSIFFSWVEKELLGVPCFCKVHFFLMPMTKF